MFKQSYAPSQGYIGAYAAQNVILVTGGRNLHETLNPLHLKALQILLFQQTCQSAGNKSYACKANDVP